MNRIGPTTLMLCLCLNACNKSKDGGTQAESELSPVAASGGGRKAEVDATSRTAWAGFDFDAGQPISVEEMAASTSWDLAFKRTSIKMNGAAVKMQTVDQDYAALDKAPKDGYVVDEPSTETGAPETAGLAFHKDPAWYVYDMDTHVVSSRGLVYVVETNAGRHFKLKFDDYYNGERLPAFINFEYQELEVAP